MIYLYDVIMKIKLEGERIFDLIDLWIGLMENPLLYSPCPILYTTLVPPTFHSTSLLI